MINSTTYKITDALKIKPKIAIIGAGLSGLTMGYRLQQKGHNVSIYEARQRVGGRVQTAYLKNHKGDYSIAELGGQNITDGGEAKYFLNLASELGLKIEEDRRRLLRASYINGKIHDMSELMKSYNISQKEIRGILKNLSASAFSIADIIDKLFADNLLLKRNFSYYMGAYEGLSPAELAVSPHNLKTLEYFLVGGAALSVKNDKTFLLKYVRGGNSKLPLALAQTLNSKIYLEKVLWKVSRSEGKIKLEFKDHTTTFCDKLILSMPCKVFEDICWEESVIPTERLKTISNVQYGSNGKAVLAINPNRQVHPYSSINQDNVGAFHNNDYNLLVLYTDGIWGKELKKNLKNYYPSMIKMVEANYGNLQRPLPEPVFVSDVNYEKYEGVIAKSWAEDLYAKGSYSALGTRLGEKFLDQTLFKEVPVKNIFAPIEEQVFFIGEHTSIIKELGTMEAAIESAERISKLL